jgi:hypothetical protein
MGSCTKSSHELEICGDRGDRYGSRSLERNNNLAALVLLAALVWTAHVIALIGGVKLNQPRSYLTSASGSKADITIRERHVCF